ncbi:MAG: ABC transporter substrate-binding protein, partial [Bacillota bacterium]
MSQKKKWSALVVALVLAALLVTSCSSPQKTETKVLAPERKIKTIEIWTMTPEYSQDRYEAALMIASWWKQLGLDVQAKPMDGTVISSKTRTPPWDFDTYMLQWFGTPERIDPQLFIYQVFHSSQDVEGGANRSGYRNPEYDQLAEAQMRETNPEKRQEYVLKAQELLAEDVPVITLYFKNLRQVYNHDRFSGIVEMPGVGINNIWTFLRAEPKTTDRVLRVASPDDCDNLNPMIAWINADWDILYLIYDTLVRLGPDGQPTPSAASSWEFKSPTVLQVKLKEGLKFHDGKPLTAEDVKFTFEYALKWGMPKVAGFVKPVKAVRVLDQHTLEFETAQPVGSLVSGTLAAVPILPKHIWEGLLEREKIAKPADWANPHPIGSGPLKFRYWRRGEEIRLDTFKEYHTPAKIDGVLQIIYPSPDALLGAMELGKADLTMQDLA